MRSGIGGIWMRLIAGGGVVLLLLGSCERGEIGVRVVGVVICFSFFFPLFLIAAAAVAAVVVAV